MGHFAGVLMYLVAVATMTAEPSTLRPVAPWAVEYADNMCVLSRGFGGTVQEPGAVLALRPLPLSTRGEMLFVIPSAGPEFAKSGKVKVTLLPSGTQQQVPFERRSDPTTKRTVTSFDVSSEFLGSLRDADGIEIAAGRDTPVRLATGKAAKALAALEPCQDDLLKSWGYDPAVKDRIETPAAPVGGGLGAWFGREYYPAEAVRLGHEGRTTVAWTIDETGKTKDCRVLSSSGNRPLDLTTCAIILQKARFKPAYDRGGRPIVSYQVQAIRWSLED